MKKLVLALCAAAALAPAAAAGGGFATVGLDSLPPDGLKAGQQWAFDLTVLAHGRTPVDHVQPIVRIRGDDGTASEFAAAKTKKPGVYHAVVRFPTAGTWAYEIDDGYSQTHTYKPIEVVAASSPSSGFPTRPVGGIALALLLAGALLLFLRRSRRAPQAAPLGP